MKKLLLRFCLIAGFFCATSCVFHKQTAPQEPAPSAAVQQEQNATAALPSSEAPAPEKQNILPDDEESEPGPAVLPGDLRPGLRTPRLPETLLYDLDGKLITPTAS